MPVVGGHFMKLRRRRFLRLAAGVAALPAMPRIASARDYPIRPVHLIVGFAPGGGNDITINAALVDPTMKARLAELGGDPMAGSPADFGKLIADETEKWAKVIKTANIKPE
jgi:tripartite-type tricarboxylate transporter receptor subunit TctC